MLAQEAFIEGHIHALEFFGGVPKRLIYDKLRTSVKEEWGRNVKTSYVLDYYLSVLEQRPRALWNAKPLKEGPPQWSRVKNGAPGWGLPGGMN
ncbi:hypothetical protein [Thermanaeromonas toyohensis]|uniref:hypothetical protein n=1 Tax=Thermanaeromonas toyohensis TaxID=161154 RepID=UPI0012F4EDD5|nr:hypothetical protein [Thermanaeromonas toyohensis]